MFTLIIIISNQIATRYPEKAKKFIKGAMYKEVESVMSNAEFEEHFSPPYNVGKKFFEWNCQPRNSTILISHFSQIFLIYMYTS